MKNTLVHQLKKISLIGCGLFTLSMGSFSFTAHGQVNHNTYPVNQAQQFGEWRYIPTDNPPTLVWWNQRMPMVPTLSISFLPNKIILNAVTPIWPDTGILFYIKDKVEKQGISLTLNHKDNQHCYYQATIYGQQDQQIFIDNLVSSRKARLITPSSYSQSLSLKHVYEAMTTIISSHPELHMTLPAKQK